MLRCYARCYSKIPGYQPGFHENRPFAPSDNLTVSSEVFTGKFPDVMVMGKVSLKP
jgi:hypothetical protein